MRRVESGRGESEGRSEESNRTPRFRAAVLGEARSLAIEAAEGGGAPTAAISVSEKERDMLLRKQKIRVWRREAGAR